MSQKTQPEIEKWVALSRERSARGLAAFYKLLYSEQGWKFPPHLAPVADALADPRITNLLITATPGSGKSQLTSVAYPLWELSHNPGMTIMGISGAESLMVGFVKSSMDLIENSHNLKVMFPDMVPNKDSGWTASGFFVKGRPPGVPDPSYAAYGLQSSTVTGRHAKLIILDDPHDPANSATPDQIQKVVDIYYANISGRRDPEGSRILVVGRRWATDDLYGLLARSNEFVYLNLPAWRFNKTGKLFFDAYVPPDLECVFSERAGRGGKLQIVYGDSDGDDRGDFFWPDNVTKKQESLSVQKSNPGIFESVYQGNPTIEEGRIFEPNDFSHRHALTPEKISQILKTTDSFILEAWDTSFSSEMASDYSVGVAALVVACDRSHGDSTKESTPHNDVYLIDLVRHRWDFKKLVHNVRWFYNKYRPRHVLIEERASGTPLISTLKEEVPLYGVSDKSISKRGRVLQGARAGSVQGWFRMGRVFFPKEAPWVHGAISELLEFTGKKGGVDDQVDAITYLINFAIDSGVSGMRLSHEYDSIVEEFTEEPEDKSIYGSLENKDSNMIKDARGLGHLIKTAKERSESDPVRLMFGDVCLNCRFYDKDRKFCQKRNISMPILGYCPQYEEYVPDWVASGDMFPFLDTN